MSLKWLFVFLYLLICLYWQSFPCFNALMLRAFLQCGTPLQVVFDLILILTTLTPGNLYDMSTVTAVSCFISLCWECAMADVNITNWKCISKNFGYIDFKSIFFIMVHWHLSVYMGKILQQIALLKVQSIKIKS